MQRLVPPLLFLFCVLLMFMLDHFYPIREWLNAPYNLLGTIPLGFGSFILISTLIQYKKTQTQINTFKKPKKLITNGFFQYTRNPLYLAFTLMLSGIAILFGSVTSLIPVVFFFLVSNFWYVPFEEKNMERVFGTSYLSYKEKVRRWI